MTLVRSAGTGRMTKKENVFQELLFHRNSHHQRSRHKKICMYISFPFIIKFKADKTTLSLRDTHISGTMTEKNEEINTKVSVVVPRRRGVGIGYD